MFVATLLMKSPKLHHLQMTAIGAEYCRENETIPKATPNVCLGQNVDSQENSHEKLSNNG